MIFIERAFDSIDHQYTTQIQYIYSNSSVHIKKFYKED